MTHRTALLATAALAALVACDEHAETRAYDIARPPVTLHAIGATVAKPLVGRWAEQYAMVDPSVTVAYDAAGSGAGIRAAMGAQSDLSLSDEPLTDAQATTSPQVVNLPVAVEAIAIVASVAGVGPGQLRVNEDALADLMTGRTKWWDDAPLAALNPGMKLPHTAVRPLYRADASGSTDLVTEWLTKASHRWPAGTMAAVNVGLGVQKDDGMIARLRGSDGSFGYLSASVAQAQHFQVLAVPNAAGRFVTPTLEAMRAAAASADVGASMRAHLVAAPGDLAYPLCAFTFALVRNDRADPAARTAAARFLWWAVHDGQAFLPPLGFAALPGAVQLRDESALRALPLGKDRQLGI